MAINLSTPLSEKDITKLNIGDEVLLNGTIFAARDKAHLFFLDNNFSRISNSVIYHCGPIIKKENSGWKAVAAGPTTSARLNPYTPRLIEKYKIKAIIGKGGMDNSVLEALRGKAVYLSAIGGAAALYAKAIKVKSVYKLEEFGMAEAIWEFEVKNFPAIVSMDAKDNSLHENIRRKSRDIFLKLISRL